MTDMEPVKDTSWGIPMLAGALSGGFVGLPVSYFFQHPLVRNKVDVFGYMEAMFTEPQSFVENGIMGPVIMAALICGAAGGAFGYFSARGAFASKK